jgi:glycosyltransferase involved in cell wall biosynthesis
MATQWKSKRYEIMGFPTATIMSDGRPWPRISVVTPSYNQGGFIEETIQSVLDQNYPNLEYIIIDGGSTDHTIDVIKRYERHLAYWVSEKDNGASDAVAKGFARATGSIMAYLNSDDIYLEGALHAAAETIEHSKADIVYGNTYWIDAGGHRIGERRQTPFVASGYLYGGFDLQQPATFWRREIFLKAGGMDPSFLFAFDTDLFFRFVRDGARFKHMNRFIAGFRIHPASKSSTERTRCERELDRLHQTHLRHPYRSLPATCVRNLARIRRMIWYVLQGDLLWLVGRIPDRFRSRKSDTIVGPRAKWI